MKKTILLCSLVGLLSNFSFSQVSINTAKPKGIFHIDAKGDNGTSDTPTNITDDVVVDSNGNVGVGGILSPTVKLDIKGSIRLIDGTQQAGRMLTSQDGTGKAKWVNKPTSRIVTGKINNNSGPISESPMNVTLPEELGGPLILTPGKWLVISKFVVKKISGPDVPNQNIWIYLKNESTGNNETIVGQTVEQSGTYEGTAQISYVVTVPSGSSYTYNIYASTSNGMGGSGGNSAKIGTEPNYQGSIFYALLLDEDTL